MTYIPSALRQLVYATDTDWASDHYLTQGQSSGAYEERQLLLVGRLLHIPD